MKPNDAGTGAQIGVITAVMVFANTDASPVNHLVLIPTVTLVLAFLRPVLPVLAVLYTAALHLVGFLGWFLATGQSVVDDWFSMALVIAVNAGLSATVTGLRMRHRKAAITAGSTGQVHGRALAVNLYRALVYGVLTGLSLRILV